jgi:predicted RND superfamily exporter protein
LLVKGDIFTARWLALMQRLSEALEQIDGVKRVDSLATVATSVPADDGMEISPLLHDGIPADAAGLARLKAKALANPVFVKNLVSADAHAAGILVFTHRRRRTRDFNSRFSAAVDAVLARESVSGVTTYQIGGPAAEAYVRRVREAIQTTLVPLSVVTLFFA